MSITLTEARRTLLDSVLHATESGTFAADQLDRAIQASGDRFLRETGISRTTIEVTASNGTNTINPTTVAEDFLPGLMFDRPFIASDDWRPLMAVSFDTLRREYELSSGASGRPEMIAWISPEQAYLFPEPDDDYTIVLPYQRPLVAFGSGSQGAWASGTSYVIGDLVTDSGSDYRCIEAHTADGSSQPPSSEWESYAGGDVEDPDTLQLNVNDAYVYDWIWWGCRAYMLLGLPGHTEAGASMQEFRALIDRVTSEAVNTGIHYTDRRSDLSRAYGPRGWI